MDLPVYISMTTISRRLGTLDNVIGSLLTQTHHADKIILNISEEPYLLDAGVRAEDLPDQTKAWVAAGKVELHSGPNLGSYRKILPTLERYQGLDYWVATADDDVFYPEGWLEGLVRSASEHQCVAAYRCRLMRRDGDRVAPYLTWPLVGSFSESSAYGVPADKPSLYLFPTGRGGVMYHSRHFRDLASLRELRELAPGQDDIALKFLTMIQNVPVILASIPGDKDVSAEFLGVDDGPMLWVVNASGANDLAIMAILGWCRLKGVAV